MPSRFGYSVAKENFVCLNTANTWIHEYKKFLFLQFWTKEWCVPSECVYLVWRMHHAHMPHYRQMCMKLFGEYIPHVHENLFGVSGREAQAYDKTKAFYTEIFMGPPIERVWEPNAQGKLAMRNQMF